MNRNLKIYLIIVAVVIGLLALLQINKTPLVDWRKTFDVSAKSPFGLYVFNQEVDSLFQGKIQRVTDDPYSYFSKYQPKEPANILMIEQYFDNEGWKKILEQVQKGSRAMLLYERFPFYVQDSLHFNESYAAYLDKINLSFTDSLRPQTLEIEALPNRMAIQEIDPKITEVLGRVHSENIPKDKAYFIKVKYGKGEVYLHLAPLLATNYYLLKEEGAAYAQAVFSYLPNNRPTIWFTTKENKDTINGSPLRFILAHPPLRYAWYLFLVGLLIFIVFRAKRRQRVVPIIRPLRNTSVEFVRNIGNLYLNEGDAKNMALKKATYFLNKVRTELLIDTTHLDENFAEKLQLKTKAAASDIARAMQLLHQALDEKQTFDEKTLIELNTLLDKIYK